MDRGPWDRGSVDRGSGLASGGTLFFPSLPWDDEWDGDWTGSTGSFLAAGGVRILALVGAVSVCSCSSLCHHSSARQARVEFFSIILFFSLPACSLLFLARARAKDAADRQ